MSYRFPYSDSNISRPAIAINISVMCKSLCTCTPNGEKSNVHTICMSTIHLAGLCVFATTTRKGLVPQISHHIYHTMCNVCPYVHRKAKSRNVHIMCMSPFQLVGLCLFATTTGKGLVPQISHRIYHTIYISML